MVITPLPRKFFAKFNLNKWVARGLDQDTLEKIRNTVFALAAPTP